MEDIDFRPIYQEDLDAVVEIHLNAFPERALAGLGREAIRRYYQWQLEGIHDAVALGCFNSNRMVGYCFAGVYRGSLSGFLRKNRWFLVGRVVTHPWLIFTPLFRERMTLAWNILLRWPDHLVPQIKFPQKSFGILAIAVEPQRQRSGLGRQLMAEIERIATNRDFSRMHLTVDIQNVAAISFYQKMNWQKFPASDGIWYGTMTRCLNRCDE